MNGCYNGTWQSAMIVNKMPFSENETFEIVFKIENLNFFVEMI